MKFLWLSALLFSQAVLAYCPDEDQQVTLQGTLIQQTRPGAPNYESIKDGDEAVTYDYLQLGQPFECEMSGESENVPLVQLILPDQKKIGYPDLAPRLGKEVIVTGKTMYAQTGRHYTPVLLILDDVKDVTPIATPEQKRSALIQFQQFQQTLREKNAAAVKAWFVFPLEGSPWDFIPYDESKPSLPDELTEAVFDNNVPLIIAGLQRLTELEVNPETLTIKTHRINALSAQEQKRHYLPGGDDGTFYYEENGQRHTVTAICDTVAEGYFEDGALILSIGSSENAQLPDHSGYCEGASLYTFKLVDGKLRLVGSITAG